MRAGDPERDNIRSPPPELAPPRHGPCEEDCLSERSAGSADSVEPAMAGWVLRGLAASCELIDETYCADGAVAITFEVILAHPRSFVTDITLEFGAASSDPWDIHHVRVLRSLRAAGGVFTQVFADVDTKTTTSDQGGVRRISIGAAARRLRLSILRRAAEISPAPRKAMDVVGYTALDNPGPDKVIELANAVSKMRQINWATPLDAALLCQLTGYCMYNLRKYIQAAEYFHQAAQNALSAALSLDPEELGVDEEELRIWVIELELIAAYGPTQYDEKIRRDSTATVQALQRVASLCSCDSAAAAMKLVDSTNVSHYSLRSCILDLDPALLLGILQSRSSPQRAKLCAASYLEQFLELSSCSLGPQLIAIGCVVSTLIGLHHDNRDPLGDFLANSLDEALERIVDYVCLTLPHLSQNALHVGLVDHLYRALGEPASDAAVHPRQIAQLLRLISHTVKLVSAGALVPSGVVKRIFHLVQDAQDIVARRAAFHAWDSISTSLLLDAKGSTVDRFQNYFVLFGELLGRLLYTTSRDLPEQHYKLLQASITDEPKKLDRIVLEKRVAVASPTGLRRLLKLIGSCILSLSILESDIESYTVLKELKDRMQLMATKLSLSIFVDVVLLRADPAQTTSSSINKVLNYSGETLEELAASSLDYLEIIGSTIRTLQSGRRVFDPITGIQIVSCVTSGLCHYSPCSGLVRLLVVWIRFVEVPQALGLDLFRGLMRWIKKAEKDSLFTLVTELLDVCAPHLTATDVTVLLDALLDQDEETLSGQGIKTTMRELSHTVAKSCPQTEVVESFLKSKSPSVLRNVSGEVLAPAFYLGVVLDNLLLDRADRSEAGQSSHLATRSDVDMLVDRLQFVNQCLVCATYSSRDNAALLAGELAAPVLEKVLELQNHDDHRVITSSFDLFRNFINIVFGVCDLPPWNNGRFEQIIDLREVPERIPDHVKKGWGLLVTFADSCIYNQRPPPELLEGFLQCLKATLHMAVRPGNLNILQAISLDQLECLWDTVCPITESFSKRTSESAEQALYLMIAVTHTIAVVRSTLCAAGNPDLERFDSFADLRVHKTVQKKLNSSRPEERLHGARLFQCWLINQTENAGCLRCTRAGGQAIWTLMELLVDDMNAELSAIARELVEEYQRKSHITKVQFWLPDIKFETAEAPLNDRQGPDLDVFLRSSVSYEHQLPDFDRGHSISRRHLGSGNVIDLCDELNGLTQIPTPDSRDAVEDGLLASLLPG